MNGMMGAVGFLIIFPFSLMVLGDECKVGQKIKLKNKIAFIFSILVGLLFIFVEIVIWNATHIC